jgi:hypothetical protein
MKYYKVKKIDECSICLEDYKIDEMVIMTSCHHKYHIDCILKWYEKNRDCPICRNTLEKLVNNNRVIWCIFDWYWCCLSKR